MSSLITTGRALLIALALGGTMTALPAQAAPAPTISFQLNFGSIGPFTKNGVTIQFRNGRFTNNYCLTTAQLRQSLRNSGYSNIVVVSNLGNHRLLLTAKKGSRWYQIRVDTCSGLVDQVQRIYRNSGGGFTLSFSFGTIPATPKEDLVCLVTFFERSQVAAGADADVESGPDPAAERRREPQWPQRPARNLRLRHGSADHQHLRLSRPSEQLRRATPRASEAAATTKRGGTALSRRRASRASQEASLVSLISIIALVCNFTGVLLLARHGVPHRLLADSLALEHDPVERILCGTDRRKMLSFVGMVLFALGTALLARE